MSISVSLNSTLFAISILKSNMDIINFLQYEFIQRALLAGSFIGVVCAILGVFLVLRKMSLIGDGLSHVSFGAIALGLFFGIYPFYVAVPVVVLGSLLILKISERAKVYGDAAIGIVSSIGIAGGVILASVSRGFNVDLLSYLFGNILSVNKMEVILSVALSVVVIVVILFFYWDLFAATLDEEYAKTIGVKVKSINALIALLTALAVVLSIKMVGVMLVSSLLILPAVTALQIAKKFSHALILSCCVALFSVLIGITTSFFLDLPAGATIIMVNAAVFAVTLVYRKIAK